MLDLVLSTWLNSVDALKDIPNHVWSNLADILDRPQYRELRKLEIRVHGSVGRADVAEWMGLRLPNCAKRGILQFT